MAIIHIKDRALSYIALTFTTLLMLSIFSGIAIPIYSDEAVTKWIFSGSSTIYSLFPQCNSASVMEVPAIFRPAAIFFSLIYSHLSPLGLRITGVITALIGLAFLYHIIRIKLDEKKKLLITYSLAFGPISFGVMPYLLLIARAEQIITLALFISCFLCVYKNGNYSKNTYYPTILFFLFTTTCLAYIHPKAIFFLPFSLFCAFWLTRLRRKIFTFTISLVIIYAYFSLYKISVFISQCENAPLAQKILNSNFISASLLWESPLNFFQLAWQNASTAPEKIVEHLLFQSNYQSGWLPPTGTLGLLQTVINTIAKPIMLWTVIIGHIGAIVVFFYSVFKGKPSVYQALAFFLAIGSLSSAVFITSWNFYSATLYVPLSVVLMILILPNSYSQPKAILMKRFWHIELALPILSLISILSVQLPTIIKNSTMHNAEIANQPLSIPVFGVDKEITTIKRLAAMCKLPENSSRHLVIDHMTYYAFTRLQYPIHALYVSESIYGADLANGRLLPFLEKINSAGIIARCSYFPPQLNILKPIKLDGYCCASFQ